MILSTDVGNEIDDQWAITYLLTSSNFDVQGIISAHAPSLPDPSAHYTYKILVDVVEKRLGLLTHPPLFEGSSLPLADRSTPRRNRGVDFVLATSQHYSKAKPLVILTIGAATDVASAILLDPTICERIKIVAMGFKNLDAGGGKEYNVENDPRAWQVILESQAPVVIGSGDVCQAYLALKFKEAESMLHAHGEIGRWLWEEYQAWYFRSVKPLRVPDFSKPWIIWDIVTLAYVEGMANAKQVPRPRLANNLSFEKPDRERSIEWVISVDSHKMWADFLRDIDLHQATHHIHPEPQH